MNIKKKLNSLVALIADEADTHPEFALKLEALFASVPTDSNLQSKRKSSRRSPGVLDPYSVIATAGEDALRKVLGSLNLEQLKDIVSEHGMDPSKLVLKWKSQEKIVDHIVDTIHRRAAKGNAFR